MSEGFEVTMREAVRRAVEHVNLGGLPFAGVLVADGEIISPFSFNRVQETGDPSSHAEIEAIRNALSCGQVLAGATLLATGEPCGMCCEYARGAGIYDFRIAADRDEVAKLGFDYRSSYSIFGISDSWRQAHMRSLKVPGYLEPFNNYVQQLRVSR